MVAKGALTGGGAAAGVPRSRRAAPEPRPMRAPRANPPRQTEVGRSTIDYGAAGSDPMSRLAEREDLMTMHATTSDLAAGTQRNTWHIPGRTGFQCATAHNTLAVEHSMGENPRKDGKVLPPAHACRSTLPKCSHCLQGAAMNQGSICEQRKLVVRTLRNVEVCGDTVLESCIACRNTCIFWEFFWGSAWPTHRKHKFVPCHAAQFFLDSIPAEKPPDTNHIRGM